MVSKELVFRILARIGYNYSRYWYRDNGIDGFLSSDELLIWLEKYFSEKKRIYIFNYIKLYCKSDDSE